MSTSKAQPQTRVPEIRRERLDSWKEIATYLKRDERTVRRWEAEGLPVHRKMHKTQASVYAYTGEIDAWWHDGRQRQEQAEQADPLKRYISGVCRDSDLAKRPHRTTLRTLALAFGLIVVIGVAAVLFANVHGWRDRLLFIHAAKPRIQSLAVLPLESLSRDPEEEHFADGMTDALITDLGKVSALTASEVEQILARARGRYKVLFALLAGTGLRIGEAFGLKIGDHLSGDFSTIRVRQSVWRGSVQTPKTDNAVREIDVAEKAGLGFKLPTIESSVGLLGLPKQQKTKLKKVA